MENLEPHEFTTQNTVRTTALWPVIETKLINIFTYAKNVLTAINVLY